VRPPDSKALALARARDQALSQPDLERVPAPALQARFREWQRGLDGHRSGRELLNALIEAPDVHRLVPMLPVEDLHRAIHRIGLEDCVELLALTSGEQVQGLLDLELWQRDELQVERLDPWMNALMEAGPDVLGRSVLRLDDELINWIIRRSVDTIIIEEPDDFEPPDVEHVLTPDGRMCVCFPDPTERDLPVKILLDWFMRTSPVFCVDLLIGAAAALDSVLQEEAYRWRTARMADKGYVDPHEAQVIYSPPPPHFVPGLAVTDQSPAARHWLAQVVDPEQRLAAALASLDHVELLRVEQQLAYAANMAISADWLEPWDFEGQKATLKRLRAGLIVGLDVLGAADARADGRLLASHGPAIVFRTGHARILAAAEPLRHREVRRLLRSGDDPLGALDAVGWRDWAQALLARHPGLPGGAVIEVRHLAEVGARARSLAELARRAAGRPDEVGIGAWLATGLVRHLLDLPGFGALAPELLPQVVPALVDEAALRPQVVARAEAWWRGMSADGMALDLLLVEFTAQLIAVQVDDPNPRQLPWILLAP
jgi:hypothetical protein